MVLFVVVDDCQSVIILFLSVSGNSTFLRPIRV